MIIFHTPNFVSALSIFSEIQISLPNFAFLIVKSPSVTQRSVSQENAFKNSSSKKHSPFFMQTIGSNNYFTLIEKKIGSTIAKFEFKVYMAYGKKHTQL